MLICLTAIHGFATFNKHLLVLKPLLLPHSTHTGRTNKYFLDDRQISPDEQPNKKGLDLSFFITSMSSLSCHLSDDFDQYLSVISVLGTTNLFLCSHSTYLSGDKSLFTFHNNIKLWKTASCLTDIQPAFVRSSFMFK